MKQFIGHFDHLHISFKQSIFDLMLFYIIKKTNLSQQMNVCR